MVLSWVGLLLVVANSCWISYYYFVLVLLLLSTSLMRGRSVSALMGIELVLFSAYIDFFLAYYSNSNAVFNRLLKISNEVFGLNIPDNTLVFLTVFPCCLISTTFISYNIFLLIYYSSFFVLSLSAYFYAGRVYF